MPIVTWMNWIAQYGTAGKGRVHAYYGIATWRKLVGYGLTSQFLHPDGRRHRKLTDTCVSSVSGEASKPVYVPLLLTMGTQDFTTVKEEGMCASISLVGWWNIAPVGVVPWRFSSGAFLAMSVRHGIDGFHDWPGAFTAGRRNRTEL